MNVSRLSLATLLVGIAAIGTACTTRSADEPVGNTTVESMRSAGDEAVDATRSAAQQVVDGTKEAASAVADKSKDVAVAAGTAMTDSWVTAKVTTKFADEKMLDGSDINVDTTEHVVTLKGHVRSSAARLRAGEIAAGTEGVTRVVNELIIRDI